MRYFTKSKHLGNGSSQQQQWQHQHHSELLICLSLLERRGGPSLPAAEECPFFQPGLSFRQLWEFLKDMKSPDLSGRLYEAAGKIPHRQQEAWLLDGLCHSLAL